VATEAGQVALPTITTALKGLSAAGGFLASHPAVTQPLVEGGGALAALAVIPKLASAGTTLAASVGKIGATLGVPGADKLAGIGQGGTSSAATAGVDKLGATADGTAAAVGRLGAAADKATGGMDAAGSAGDKAAIGEDAAGAAGTKEAIGESAAGAAGAKEAIAEDSVVTGGTGKGGGALGAVGTAAIGLILAKSIIDALENPKNHKVLGDTNPKSPWNAWPTPTDHNNSVAGELVGNWGKPTGTVSAASESRFQSRFGINTPGYNVAAPKIPAPDISALESARSKVQAEMADINKDISSAKAAKLPAPDISALQSAKATVQADLNALNAEINTASAKPSKVASPDLSALASAKSNAAQAAAGIKSAADSAVSKPSKVASPDLSALATAKGKAASDGAQIDLGLAQGIAANAGAAVAAAESVANQVGAIMNHALQVKSPSKVTEKIGKETVAGLVLGLEGGKGSVGDASTALADAATAPWTNGTTTATYKALVADVESAFKAGTIDKSQDSAALAFLKSDTAKMQSLQHQRATIEANIKAADAYASNVQSSAISNASIVNVAGNIASADSSTSAPAPAAQYQASDLISGEQAQLTQVKQFNSQIAQLKKEGLNTTELGQIIQSGASTGLPIAQAITSGGKGAISELNSLQSQINAAAKQLGVTSGNAMYESAGQIGQGLAAGLKGELSSVVSAIHSLSTSMVDELKKDLKISSPSQVFADLAEMVPAGAAMGVGRGTGAAVSAVGRMGSQMTSAYRPSIGAYSGHGGGSGGGSGGGGGDTHITVNMTVNGSVSTQQELVNAVKKGLLKTGSNNWQTGIIRPGRAG
jgi:hypothetical protein